MAINPDKADKPTHPRGSRHHFNRPIHPVPVKPPSKIASWADWPEDVVDTLHAWNGGKGGHRLSFRYTTTGSMWSPSIGTFKCPECNEYCAEHPATTSVLDDSPICDDCLIVVARRYPVTPALR